MLKKKGTHRKYDIADDSLGILEELTGTRDNRWSKSFPPMIFGAEYGNDICFHISSERAGPNFWLNSRLDQDGKDRLKDLDGVAVNDFDDD